MRSKPVASLSRRSLAATALAAMCVAASPAGATSRSSFTDVTGISGVTITHPTSTTYDVAVGANSFFTYNAINYSIASVIGFYLLSDVNDFSPLVSLTTQGAFADDSSNASGGGIQGWKSNPNSGIDQAQSFTFSVPANFDFARIDRYGIHVRLTTGNFPGTSGNTGSITGPFNVPAPGAAGLLMLGGAASLRRRR